VQCMLSEHYTLMLAFVFNVIRLLLPCLAFVIGAMNAFDEVVRANYGVCFAIYKRTTLTVILSIGNYHTIMCSMACKNNTPTEFCIEKGEAIVIVGDIMVE